MDREGCVPVASTKPPAKREAQIARTLGRFLRAAPGAHVMHQAMRYLLFEEGAGLLDLCSQPSSYPAADGVDEVHVVGGVEIGGGEDAFGDFTSG
jgi:hypothetical protein